MSTEEKQNKTLQNTMLGLAAAGAIGTGVYLATNTPGADSEPVAEVEFVDDIEPIRVPVYTVDVWQYESPVDVWQYKSPVEKIVIDKAAIEKLSPESYEVITAFVEKYNVDNLSPKQIEVLRSIIETVEIEKLSPEQIEILFVQIESLNFDVERMMALQKLLARIVKDKRSLQHDKGLTIYNEALAGWLEVYNKPLPEPINYIPLKAGVKIIAELRSLDYAKENLAYYKKQGYNACLVTINGTESTADVRARINTVRLAGLDAWFAWAGPESLHWSVFADISKIKKLFNVAAPLCDGYLPAWRRTSVHLIEQDEKYIEFLASLVRKANPNIYVLGESYYGQTWKNKPFINQQGWTALDNVVRNQSGVLIAGISTQGFAIEGALNGIFGKWRNSRRLGLVLGERPYYASTHDNKRSFRENLAIKKQLENRFIRAGCIGVITIHGDGSDRGSSLQATDDIGKYKIN